MSLADKIRLKIRQQDRLEDGVYDLWIEAKDMAATAGPGQFISLYCNDGGRLLPRPISICEIDKKKA